MTEEKWDELGEELCEYCKCTEYGEREINTAPWNLCEGAHCDEAYEKYKDEREVENG